MYLVLIAWFYITVLMALAEATASNGSILGAIVTFVFYGLLPMSILFYIMGTPARKRALRRQREQEPTPSIAQPDTSGHAPGASQDDGVAPVREKT